MKTHITFREVLIVLVLLGLCFLIGWNIRSLYLFAGMRDEASKVEKITTALNVYHAKSDKFNSDTPHGLAADMIDSGYIAPEDFYTEMGGGYWNFISCANDLHENYFMTSEKVDSASGVCLYLSPEPPTTEKTYYNNNTSSRIACYVESVIDNMDAKLGKGRGGMEFISNIGTRELNCYKEPETDKAWYLFRIF